MLYACDADWWHKYFEQVKDLGPELWTQDIDTYRKYKLNFVHAKRGEGLGRGTTIHWGANSGYQAINLAYLWGAKRILLLGYDCKNIDGKAHWFGQHPQGLNRNQPLDEWKRNFPQLAADLQDEGVEVINCSPDSALTCFKGMDLDEAIIH